MHIKIAEYVIDLLFPPKCVFCNKLTDRRIDREKFICNNCRNKLPWNTHSAGITKGNFFVKCVSPLFFKDNVRASIHRFKFRGSESYADTFAKLICERLDMHPEIKFDIVTWVPISRRRYNKRGYDQARSIAAAVAKYKKVPLVSSLKKIRHTKAQSTLEDSSQRRANVTGAYALDRSSDVCGLSILLIDDVVTTGSTLSECSRTLLMAGAETVYCATLAKARGDLNKHKQDQN